MGMDIHGLNPKQNKGIGEFPTYAKYKKMEQEKDGFNQKWKELDEDEELRNKYWAEEDEFNAENKGVYFRNNCWWWRPLWNYCYFIADDLISEELFNSGHSNSGAGLDAYNAERLGQRLLEEINNGKTIEYQAQYQQYLDDIPDDDCLICNNNNHGHNKKKDCNRCEGTGKRPSMNKSYPFDVDNVKDFAEFCIESGGFEIC